MRIEDNTPSPPHDNTSPLVGVLLLGASRETATRPARMRTVLKRLTLHVVRAANHEQPLPSASSPSLKKQNQKQ